MSDPGFRRPAKDHGTRSQNVQTGRHEVAHYVEQLVSLFSEEARGAGFCTGYALHRPANSAARAHFEQLSELERETAHLLVPVIRQHWRNWAPRSVYEEQHRNGIAAAGEFEHQAWRDTVRMILVGGLRYLQRIGEMAATCPVADRGVFVALHSHEQAIVAWAQHSASEPSAVGAVHIARATDAVRQAKKGWPERLWWLDQP